jgi:polyisoprenyl-teichoic acid--peptidoglycan teichoic acid transferase
MAGVESARGGWSRSLLLAAATLILPLTGITAGALAQPMPLPPSAPPPRVEFVALDEPLAQAIELPPPLEPEPIADPAPAPPVALTLPLDPFPRWNREQTLNVLLVGVDRREVDEIYRTDTLILARLDLRARQAVMMSIPRDLVVTIPGYGQDRINAAYAVGEVQKRPGGGLALLRETVERNFGVAVQHWAVVDFNCFRGAVDAVGGVTLNVQQRIYDPFYPTEDYGYQTVVFEPGKQWLNGERALEYARSRYGDTDFGRMRRQQQVLSAIREQALQVKSLTALPQAVRACSGMASDLNLLDLVALGAAAREIRPSDIAMRVIDERLAIPYTAPSGAAVLLPRWDDIRALVKSSFVATSTPSTSVAAAN